MRYIQLDSPPLPHYVNCGIAFCNKGEGHAHRKNNNVFDLIVVYKGVLYIEEDGEKWTVKPGQALILNPLGEHFSPKPSPEATYFYWLHFDVTNSWKIVTNKEIKQSNIFERSVRRLNNFSIHLPKFYSIKSPKRVYALLDKLNIMMSQQGEEIRWKEQIIFQNLINEIIESNKEVIKKVTNNNTSANFIADQAASYMRQHYQENINYDRIEDELGYNPTYISRCMKKTYNITLLEYLKQYRMEKAKLLLINTNLSIANITEKVGYNNTSYFIKSFNQYEKLTPKKFRDKYRILTTHRWDIKD